MWPPMSTSVSATLTRRRNRSTRPIGGRASRRVGGRRRRRAARSADTRRSIAPQPPHFIGVEEPHLASLDPRQRELGDRVVRDQTILERGVDALVHQLHDAMDRRRREVRRLRRAQVRHPGPQRGAVESADRRVPEHGQRMSPEGTRVPCVSARAQVRDRRPPPVPPLGNRHPAEAWIDQRALLPVDLDDVRIRSRHAGA